MDRERTTDADYVLVVGDRPERPGRTVPEGAAHRCQMIREGAQCTRTNLRHPGSQGPRFLGILDPTGNGAAIFNTLGPMPPGMAGTTMSFAYALNMPWDFVSNPVNIEIIP